MKAEHYIIDASELAALDKQNWIIVDLSEPEAYDQGHIENAVNVPYSAITIKLPPCDGMVPPVEVLADLLGHKGIDEHTNIVAYDRDGGGKSGRFIWTLDWLGHKGERRWLNGGFGAWLTSGQLASAKKPALAVVTYIPQVKHDLLATKESIMASLSNPNVVVLDARTPGEYAGTDVRAKHGGHIPGAVNQNWITLKNADQTLKTADERKKMLTEQKISSDQRVIVHCQTHHRSGLSYISLKSLGFNKVSGYAGSWSEWGNIDGLPVEKA